MPCPSTEEAPPVSPFRVPMQREPYCVPMPRPKGIQLCHVPTTCPYTGTMLCPHTMSPPHIPTQSSRYTMSPRKGGCPVSPHHVPT